MRFSKLIIIGILLIIAGVLLVYRDQSRGKTRACERRVRKADTAVCTWTYLGETKVWVLDAQENESLFTELQEVMLDDLEASREEGVSASIPEYKICIKDRYGKNPFDFNVFTGGTTWVECSGGMYQSKGHTQKFLRQHVRDFAVAPSEETEK